MKIVGFKALKQPKKKKRFIIVSYTNVFRKLATVMAIMLLIFCVNLISKTFITSVTTSINEFMEHFVLIK